MRFFSVKLDQPGPKQEEKPCEICNFSMDQHKYVPTEKPNVHLVLCPGDPEFHTLEFYQVTQEPVEIGPDDSIEYIPRRRPLKDFEKE